MKIHLSQLLNRSLILNYKRFEAKILTIGSKPIEVNRLQHRADNTMLQ